MCDAGARVRGNVNRLFDADGESVQGDVASDARDDETDDGGDERYEFDVVCDAVCGGAWTG